VKLSLRCPAWHGPCSLIDASSPKEPPCRITQSCFVIALVAAVFGFTGVAVGAAEIAKILFLIFLVLFAVSP
jgi:uncharacterized membrane protein YtjA (UPF0391 family)